MIKTRKDLKLYLQEDAKANRFGDASIIEFWARWLMGSESATVYRYLKILRHCEFHCNNGGFLHKMLYGYYKIRLRHMGLKYNISIPVNVCGYGTSIIHLAGGGGCLINAKRVGNYCKFQTGVLLGNSHHSSDDLPVLGDYVSFGPGAKVLGGGENWKQCFHRSQCCCY